MVSAIKPSNTSRQLLDNLSSLQRHPGGPEGPRPYSRQQFAGASHLNVKSPTNIDREASHPARTDEAAPDRKFGALGNFITRRFFGGGRQQAQVVTPPPVGPVAVPPSLSPELTMHIDEAAAICRLRYGLEPGSRMLIYVNDQLMVLRCTQTGDGFVLQTPEQSETAPFNGLYFAKTPNGEGVLKLNMEPVSPSNPYAYEIARNQLASLVATLRT